MIIRIPIFFSLASFFLVVNAMDVFVPETTRKRSKDIIISVESSNKKTQSGSVVPPLDLNIAHSHGSSEGSQKRTINNLTALKTAASTRLTSRRNGASSTTTRNMPTKSGDSPSSEPIPTIIDSPKKAPSVLPRAMKKEYSGKFLLQQEKMYSEQDLWEKLKTFNTPLYSFGQKYNMDIEQLETFAMFLQEHDVSPTVIAEHIRGDNITQEGNWWLKLLDRMFGNVQEQRFNRFNEHFEEIKRKNPQSYEELVLELMKITADSTEGVNIRSQIDETHNALLMQENSSQVNQIRVQYIQMFLGLISAIGMGAWAIYGQVGTAPLGNVTMT